MGKTRCIIIEDEPLAMDRMKDFVSRVSTLNLLSTFNNALDGLQFLKTNQVDLLFLDIQMDEISGIELLEIADIKCQVIFTTAYQQYALKGYELNVTDYLLKPFTFSRFLQAVNKVDDLKSKDQPTKMSSFIFVKTENRLEKILLDDILFIEGMRDYRRIHLADKSIMTLQKFSELEEMIPREIVSRVHKSYMVALSKIKSVERGRIIISDKIIPISTTYKKAFFDLILER